MPRDAGVYLEDILTAFTRGLDRVGFGRDPRTIDAVLHNLEVIGEAAKHVPVDLRARAPGVEWRKVAGMRDLIAHAYFEVDLDIVWDVVATKFGPLAEGVRALQGR